MADRSCQSLMRFIPRLGRVGHRSGCAE